ncbi:MAG: hypothetical protein QM778_23650 [Myxococcales bacterium]
MSDDPLRLLAEPELSRLERSVLEAGQVTEPADFDFARAELRLMASLSSAASGSERAPHPVSKPWKKPGFKLFLGLVAMGAMFVGLGPRLVRRPAPLTSSQVHSEQSSTAVPQPESNPVPVVTELAAPAARDEAPIAPSRERPTTPDRPRPTAKSPSVAPGETATEPTNSRSNQGSAEADDPRAELRAMAQAKALSARDPGAALVALHQIRARFPAGYFVEEREALTILVLAQLGQISEARRQAQGFLARYPNGPHSDRVRRSVTSSP